MKYPTVTIALVLSNAMTCDGLGMALSFRKTDMIGSSFVPKLERASSWSGGSTLNMLVQASGGMLELEEFLDSDKGVSKTVRKSPKLWKAARIATIPASLALGYSIVPSSKIAFSAAGAIASSLAGLIGRNKMKDLGGDAAWSAIAQCLVDDGISNAQATAGKILEIKDEFAVHPDDFTWICLNIYRKYLVGMLKYDAKPQGTDLEELESLKGILALDNLDVGEAHVLAAQDWQRACKFVTQEALEDEDCKERMSINKLFYLTERSLRQNNEPREAFTYEMSRTCNIFNTTIEEALVRVEEEVVGPFYARALKSSRSKLGTNQVSSIMLERARQTIGISSNSAKNLHENVLNDEVRSLLGYTNENESNVNPYTVTYPEGARERLEKLCKTFGLDQKEVYYEIVSEGMPLFSVVGLDVMKDAVSGGITPEEAWERIDQRRKELLIPEDKLDELVSTLVVNSMGTPLQDVKKYIDVNNEGAVYSSMMEVLQAKKIIEQLLKKSGWNGDFYKAFCNPNSDIESINSLMNSQQRKIVYELVTTRSMEGPDGKTGDELNEFTAEVQGILGIEEKQVEVMAIMNFGPKLDTVLRRAMLEIIEDYTPALLETLKKEVRDVISEYKINEGLIISSGRDLYQEALKNISDNAPAGVPTQEQNEALSVLQKFYGLDDVSSFHLNTFGPIYKKSIEEAMSITGVIRPEFRKPLENLRDRLGVSSEQTRLIFLDAVKIRMIPMVEWIVSEMEKTVFSQEQLSKRRGKDMGEDYFQSGKKADGNLGLGAEANVLSDIMNLIDFYTENDIAVQNQIDSQKVEKTVEVDDEKKTIEEEVPVYETLYPITALETGAVDSQMAEVLYRQFVVGSFTTKGPDAVRYENSRSTFGGILGLSSEKMEDIGSGIADTVYDNYVGQSMRTKGALDQQDMMFLANLQPKLGLTPEQGEIFMKKAQNKILKDEYEQVMDSATAESIKTFRERCEGMGIDLSKDLELTKDYIQEMFEIEIAPGLESGEITIENVDILVEIQESLGLDEKNAEESLTKLLVQRSQIISEAIEGAIRRGRINTIVEPVKQLVRYGAFLNGNLGIEMEEEAGQQVLNAYKNFDTEGLSEEKVEENQEMLKTILSLS